MPPGVPSPVSTAGPGPLFRLEGAIPPRPVPFTYRFTLALGAFVLVLLPLVYVGLITFVGWGIWYYAHNGVSILTGSGGVGLGRLIVYFGPIVAGLILIAFMVKPFFARRPEAAEPLELDLEQEPLLRDMIRDICARVGAPMPSVVNVDCQVNASARLRRGLFSLGRRDLALTIGLPLAANLSARQLAGVLAHEFGHFAQGGGMALTYVIRSINGWFSRVVFERDSSDHDLEEWSQKGDFRIAIVLLVARGGVWVGRRILHGLMYVGHATTCLQLRQMEFDADYYETHVAGSADFVRTSRELACLGPAMGASLNELGQLWNRRQLVDDLPGFVALRRGQLTAEIAEKIGTAQMEARTRWFDTHPSDRDRIAHAEKLALPGIFRGDGPASRLFRDFPGLCREVTRHHYSDRLGLSFDDNALKPVELVARANEEADAAEAARQRLTGPVLNLRRPLVWKSVDFSPEASPSEPATLASALAVTRAELSRLRAAAEAAESRYNVLAESLESALSGRAFLREGVPVKPDAFGLPKSDLAAAEARVTELSGQLAGLAKELAAFEAAVHDAILLIVRTARHPAVAAALPAEIPARVARVSTALAAMRPWFEAFPEWVSEQNLFTLFAGNAQAFSANGRFMQALDRQRQRVRGLPQKATELVGDAAHPFPAEEEVTTVVLGLNKALAGVDPDGRALVLLRMTANLYFRMIGQLAADGERLDQALATLTAPPPVAVQTAG